MIRTWPSLGGQVDGDDSTKAIPTTSSQRTTGQRRSRLVADLVETSTRASSIVEHFRPMQPQALRGACGLRPVPRAARSCNCTAAAGLYLRNAPNTGICL